MSVSGSKSQPMMDSLFLGRYRVVRQLGEGGMGIVYLAKQVELNRDVVIKVMHEHIAADPRFQERFQQEMLAMAQFQHPYAVTLYDAHIETDEGPCIIMEYIKGKSLDVMLKENKRFTPERASRFLGQLCEVLQTAHLMGIVHRDLKPSNLMIMDADTQFEKIKVMDFGLAKLARAGSPADKSSQDGLLGTPAYVSPEQARGEPTDHRSDLYSLGVILYEMLTGRLPFYGMSTMDTLLAHAVEHPPSMSSGDVVVSFSVEEVVLRCMAKVPADRYQSARELIDSYMYALSNAKTAEAPVLEETLPQFAPIPDELDPSVAIFRIQAWMPRSIAAVKLSGFIEDAQGIVTDNSPGRVVVLLGTKGSSYQSPKRGFFDFSYGKPDLQMELQIYEDPNPAKRNQVWLSVIVRYMGKHGDGEWRERADRIYRDLRAYLIGSTPGF